MAEARPKIAIRDLSLAYPGEAEAPPVTVLEQASLTVQSGEFLCVVGPSGCGKTTLLKALAGLLRPSAGVIEVDGKPIAGPGRERSMVFQYDCLLPWRSVLRNTQLGWDIRRARRRESEEKARHYLQLVGLEGYESFRPHQLSGGMRQRVNLARALAVEPDILLMDEPFAALDAQTREGMQAELLRIWEATRKTVVFITHQVDEALFLADRVVVMGTRPGRILELMPVPFARPRALGLKTTPEFGAMAQHVWSLLGTHRPAGAAELPRATASIVERGG